MKRKFQLTAKKVIEHVYTVYAIQLLFGLLLMKVKIDALWGDAFVCPDKKMLIGKFDN